MLVSSVRAGLLATAATTFLATQAFAQDAFDLDTIIISGGLSPIDAAKYGRASSVVTAQDIKNRGITTVQDALRALPGVSVNGSSASMTGLRIRGGESNHTMVLIDGVLASGADEGYSLSGLDAANIERIEVLRGPQSAFYGASASTGVVNIITRKAEPGQTGRASLEVGAGTSASVFFGHRTEGGGISLALSSSDDRGYDASGDGGEKDGVRRDTAILSGDIMAGKDLKLGFSIRRSEEKFDYDETAWAATDAASYIIDDPSKYSERDEITANLFAEYSMMGGRLEHRFALETTRYDQSYDGWAPSKTRADVAKYRLSYGLDGPVDEADHLLNFLLEKEEKSSSTNPGYSPKATSVALEYRGSLANGLNVQLGARHIQNSTYEDTTTWNVGLSYFLPQSGVRLHASAGTGVVDPSYFELFASSYGYSGNPDLTPETNRSFDLGATFPIFADRGSIDVTYFNETLIDEITDIPTGGGTYGFINQSGKAKRQGVEVSGDLQATDLLALRMGYTYIDAENPDGSVETRRPRNELTLGATYETFGGRGSVSADLRHVSGNYDKQGWGAGAVEKLPAFTTLDVAARYDLNDRVTLTGRVTNVFDKETSDTWGYANRGRAIYVGLNANF
ncbi:TonB-dependent receptor plug domain-containing protein [Pseudorhodobacter aquimaris]|uniref:TonB-dependent receptor plug domain-containing protein n=1 Tax=Pseudorhodobacter aquimaris TaxID=687412 RepID=UPI00067D0FB1|nr:TonB-dependent receptor [Pseudorhodobacter aquimaris]